MSNDNIPSTRGFLDAGMVTGCYSTGLLRELETHLKNGTADIFPILAEIRTLENANPSGPSQTKAASPLRGKWLKGLWHQHFTQARFMPKNLQLHWKPARIEQAIAEALKGRKFFDEQAGKDLSRRMADGYLDRGGAGKLTGEWIIFAKQDDVAYYLTLGVHTEDEAIWRRCKVCAAEFPELQILKEDR